MGPKELFDLITSISNCFLGSKYRKDSVMAVEEKFKFALTMIHQMDFDIEMEWSICFLIPIYLSKSYPSFRVQLKYTLLPDTYEGCSSHGVTQYTSIPFIHQLTC